MPTVKLFSLESNISFHLDNGSTWGNFVSELVKKSNSFLNYILNYKGKYVGVDILLTENLPTDTNIEVTAVSSQFTSVPFYYRLKYSHHAYENKLDWPLWEKDAICPINLKPLGCWNRRGSYKALSNVSIELDNRPENLIILNYGQNKKIVNKFSFLKRVQANNNTDPFTKKEIGKDVMEALETDSLTLSDLTIVDMRPGTPNLMDKSYDCDEMKSLFAS